MTLREKPCTLSPVTRSGAGSRDASFLLNLRSGQLKHSSDQVASHRLTQMAGKTDLIESQGKGAQRGQCSRGCSAGLQDKVGLAMAEEGPAHG